MPDSGARRARVAAAAALRRNLLDLLANLQEEADVRSLTTRRL